MNSIRNVSSYWHSDNKAQLILLYLDPLKQKKPHRKQYPLKKVMVKIWKISTTGVIEN